MEYEKWEEVLAPYNHAVEELKVKFYTSLRGLINSFKFQWVGMGKFKRRIIWQKNF